MQGPAAPRMTRARLPVSAVNFMMLLNGITTCAAFGWAVPWQAVSDRLSLDMTLLLTSIAFKQVGGRVGNVGDVTYFMYVTYTLKQVGVRIEALASPIIETLARLASIDDARL